MNKDSSIDAYDQIPRIEEPMEMRMEDVFLQEREDENFDFHQQDIKNSEPTSQDNDDNSSKKPKKYKMHSVEVKRKCLELAQHIPLKKISESFGVPIKSLKRWMIVGAERKKGGGRKIRDPEMEKRLYEWYVEIRENRNLPVTSRMIKNKALELTKLEDFNASKGWLEKIKKKYKLQISRSTSSLK